MIEAWRPVTQVARDDPKVGNLRECGARPHADLSSDTTPMNIGALNSCSKVEGPSLGTKRKLTAA